MLAGVVLTSIDNAERDHGGLEPADERRNARPFQGQRGVASVAEPNLGDHTPSKANLARQAGDGPEDERMKQVICHASSWNVAKPAVGKRDWYTAQEVASRFRKTSEAVRVAADRGRLAHFVITHGQRKERRFPKAEIDALDRWPGYGSRPSLGTADEQVMAELDRLRAENGTLRQEMSQALAGSAAAEMKIDELGRIIERQHRALRALVDALSRDELDMDQVVDFLR